MDCLSQLFRRLGQSFQDLSSLLSYEDNKENQEEVFQAIREPGIHKGPLKGTKGFSPLLLLFSVVLTIFYLIYYL